MTPAEVEKAAEELSEEETTLKDLVEGRLIS